MSEVLDFCKMHDLPHFAMCIWVKMSRECTQVKLRRWHDACNVVQYNAQALPRDSRRRLLPYLTTDLKRAHCLNFRASIKPPTFEGNQMIKDTLDVGCKIGTEKFKVSVQLQYPENDADVAKLLPTEELRAKVICRGWAIMNQEASGARDIVSSATAAERKDIATLTAKVQACVDSFDATKPAKRSGAPAKPVVLSESEIKAAMSSGDTAALQAMLQAAGIKNVSFTA